MKVSIHPTPENLGFEAAHQAVESLRNVIDSKGEAILVLATGRSQFATLSTLVLSKEIDWSCVSFFHLDEYIGLPENHPASFRKYLKERFINKVGKLKQACFIEGDVLDIHSEIKRLNRLMEGITPDVTLLGIGENGHLAFNDPPANIKNNEAFLMVRLDETCRMQQVHEGWFSSFDRVPTHAITMSISKIMQSKVIIASVPHASKALAVKNTVEGSLSPKIPASYLQKHANCFLFLDRESASLLSQKEIF